MSVLTRPQMIIRLDHLIQNYQVLKKIAPKAIAAAVVKNDAYGLGGEAVARALYQNGCRHFFVAHGCEGKKVRSVVPEAAIFVLQGMGEDSVADFQEARLTPVISSRAELDFWHQNKVEGVRPIINVETGLNRLGFRPDDLKQLTDAEKKEFSFVLSHLACGDDTHHFMNERQLKAFEETRALLPGVPATLSASDGVFLGKDFHFDMVRLGAALYGLNTAPYREDKMKAVLYLSAPVLQIVDVPAGQYVGYSATYQTRRPIKLAIVSIGYGDGLARSLQGRGKIFFHGQEAPMIGRISMDNIMCDVSALSDLKEGDMVELLNDTYGADEMGQDAGTIGYEILNWIGKGGRAWRNVLG